MNKTDDMKSNVSMDELKLNVMREMGWSVEADLPMANAENLKILDDMLVIHNTRLQLQARIRTLDERNKTIEKHRKNIEGTVQQNTTFYNAVKNDVLKEAHRTQLVILERNKLREDLRNNQKELDEFTAHAEHMAHKICQNKQEIDKLTARIKSAKTTLMDWTEAMEDGNKGYQLIEKYFLDDQTKARELNTRRQKLQTDIDTRRKRVVNMYDEQNTLEKNLERTACLYRAAHVERRQMVDTWKQAVNQMTQREADIQQGERECAELTDLAEARAIDYRYHDKQLNDVIENNRLVEQAIELLNEETSGMKEQINRVIDAIYLKEREIEGLHKELDNLANTVQLKRLENRKLSTERDDAVLEIQNYEETVKEVEGRLKAMQSKTLNANQRLQILEEMNDNEDKLLRDMSKEQQRLNGIVFRTQQQINQLQDEQKLLDVKNDAQRSTLSSMRRNALAVEHELRRQTAIHYDLAFRYLEQERRLQVLRGNTVDPEIEARNQQTLSQLEQYYAKLQRRIFSTESQNKKLNYSMNAMVNVYNKDAAELELVNFKIKEAQVYCEGSIKRLRQNKFENSELIVELSLLKVRCSDLEMGIESCDQGQFTLEQQRAAFKHAVKDRFVELQAQQDILQLKRKHLAEELGTLRADLGERKQHIEAVKSRFELTARLLGVNEDGSIITATQMKVENAQQRQLLVDQGDALNQQVLKAEQDVVALENTLQQLHQANEKFRKHMRAEGEGTRAEDKARDELKQMQEVYCNGLSQLKVLRCKVQRYETQIDEHKNQLEELNNRMEALRKQLADNSDALDKLYKELDEQNSKKERAARDIRRALKEIKELPVSDDFLELFQRELDLQELENRNSKGLNLLSDMATSDDHGPAIIHYMLRKGLKMPQHLRRTRSCVSWNTGSTSSLDAASVISSMKGFSARSSASELSSGKEEPNSAHLSVISLDFPEQK